MIGKFIYIFDEKSKDKLLSKGYELFSSDEKKHVYMFLNKEGMEFSDAGITYVISNQMTL